MLKIGIIGCGSIAQVGHAPEYRANPGCRIAAFYSSSPESARLMAEEYGGICCSDMDGLLSAGLDAVSICTPNVSHAGLAVRAMEAGCHVLCEKSFILQ